VRWRAEHAIELGGLGYYGIDFRTLI
jgi:hypothetical protein